VSAGLLDFGTTDGERQTGAVLIECATLTVSSGASLDVGNHDLLIDNASVGTVTALVSSGFDDGDWLGTGIISSAALYDPNMITGLGTLGEADYYVNHEDDSFDGVTIGSTAVVVKYCYFGDLDMDGTITGNDYFYINYGYLHHYTGYANGDIDYDGTITTADFYLIDSARLTFVSRGLQVL